ncbi:MAG: SMP-30/gluconolactonase/LRE family protein [Arachnia sp.]
MPEEVQIDVVVRGRAECGEGPHWDERTGTVTWVDILKGEILTTEYSSATTSIVTYPAFVGAAAPRAAGGFVAAVATGFAALDSDGRIERQLNLLPPGVRMNDAKVDPNGIYWAGSCANDFTPGQGGLWRLDANWQASLVLDGLTQPNGLGWSPDGSTFYLVETQARRLLRFAFDPASSTLDPHPSVLVDADGFPDGVPDGLAVDEQGHLWIAMFAGAAVHEFSPQGSLLRSLAIPTLQTTSCMFVGPERDELWITSAAAQLTPEQDELAGSVFRVRGLQVHGMPVPRFGG